MRKAPVVHRGANAILRHYRSAVFKAHVDMLRTGEFHFEFPYEFRAPEGTLTHGGVLGFVKAT